MRRNPSGYDGLASLTIQDFVRANEKIIEKFGVLPGEYPPGINWKRLEAVFGIFQEMVERREDPYVIAATILNLCARKPRPGHPYKTANHRTGYLLAENILKHFGINIDTKRIEHDAVHGTLREFSQRAPLNEIVDYLKAISLSAATKCSSANASSQYRSNSRCASSRVIGNEYKSGGLNMYRNNPKRKLVLLEPVTSLLLDTKTVTFKKPYPLLLWAGGHRFYVTFPYTKPKQINKPAKGKLARIRSSFSGLPCKGALVFKMAMPENPLYEGKLLGITYPSKKECELRNKALCRVIPYIHETKKGREPTVYKTKCDMTWCIDNGAMTVKKYGRISWLVD